ncbi:hypothetical protein KJY73_13145 [Bowmanella sp. Y26]|uniref:hypothetical protein n=1 Tax=Bowmanella yangjiangensis TaxID=2811230 RepID=UPI001BDC0F70|nr:hypothetical protein [Bowmanella yangjiangensis]MBT1064529.1 hypothetical protein [Bowmanella yangjiangensis]
MTRAKRIFILGLVVGPALAEFLGLLSRFISLVNTELGIALLDFVNLVFPFSSVIFSIALIKAVSFDSGLMLKVWSYCLSLIYVFTSSYGFWEPGTIVEGLLYNSNYLCEIAALLTGGVVVYKFLKEQPSHIKAAA